MLKNTRESGRNVSDSCFSLSCSRENPLLPSTMFKFYYYYLFLQLTRLNHKVTFFSGSSNCPCPDACSVPPFAWEPTNDDSCLVGTYSNHHGLPSPAASSIVGDSVVGNEPSGTLQRQWFPGDFHGSGVQSPHRNPAWRNIWCWRKKKYNNNNSKLLFNKYFLFLTIRNPIATII